MFKLSRYFSLTSLLAFILVAVLLGLFYRQQAIADLYQTYERFNVTLTRVFANSLWPQFVPFVVQAETLSPTEIRARPEISALREAVLMLMDSSTVVKVKVYNLDGLTVFSTEAAQIGEDKRDNAGFQQARSGQPASELAHRDTFSAFEAEIVDRDLFSSYIPIRREGAEAPIEGVFEIYTDVTPLLTRIEATQRTVFFGVVLILGVLYLALYLIVRRADQILHHQYAARLAIEAELQATKENAEAANLAKTEFISLVVHELKTPMTAIKGFADIIVAGTVGPMTETQERFLRTIADNVRRMAHLVSDLGDISRIEAGRLELEAEPVAVLDVVETVVRTTLGQVEEREHELVLDVDDNLPPAWGEHTRLVQILTNLVSNAYKYTPSGGTITIRATRQESGLNGSPRQTVIHLSVSDTGIGIRDEDRQRVFEKFERIKDEQARQESGTGLGLSITRELVHLHGGQIWFESEYGQGSTFHVLLPIAPESVTRPEAIT